MNHIFCFIHKFIRTIVICPKLVVCNSKNKGIRFGMPRKVIRLFRVGSGELHSFTLVLELGHSDAGKAGSDRTTLQPDDDNLEPHFHLQD